MALSVSEQNRRKYEAMKSAWAPGTFVAVDGDVCLDAACEIDLNAKIVAHVPPLSIDRYVTCVGYEHVFSAPRLCPMCDIWPHD